MSAGVWQGSDSVLGSLSHLGREVKIDSLRTESASKDVLCLAQTVFFFRCECLKIGVVYIRAS